METKMRVRVLRQKSPRQCRRLRSRERGIRTPGTREGSTVFKTAAFDRSAISLYYKNLLSVIKAGNKSTKKS
jgi:hypothetical protein